MIFSKLRKKHPRLIYDSFALKKTEGNLKISFLFILEPDIVFSPNVSIPILEHDVDLEEIKGLAFHLGLIEALSYWKSACPPEIVVKAGHLTKQQTEWWHDLFIHGLGEFFFQNDIDFTQPDFLTIVSQPSLRATKGSVAISSGLPRSLKLPRNDENGDLILVGGGKDSIVTLESLKNLPGEKTALMLNPGPNSLAAARIASYKNPIIVTRTIDAKLLDLNKEGYLNGHTPFSAYLAFLGVLTGAVQNYKHVISSNEYSAGEGNLKFHGLEINHQYSKSYRFEKRFREYCARYLSGDIQYFSFLRPLYELQIARLFSEHSKYDTAFSSCNVARGESWCGHCPKCAFAYISLFPFMDDDRLKRIFGSDLFEQPEIQQHILDLVGLGSHKPFDCVGTKEESVAAVALAIRKIRGQRPEVSGQRKFLLSLERNLHLDNRKFVKQLEKQIMKSWSNENFLPLEYAKLLKESIFKLKT